MSTLSYAPWILAIILALWVLGAYNRLIRRRQDIVQAFIAIDLQMTVRHDLVRSLIETVRKHATQERLTLRAVIGARKASHTAQAAARFAPLQSAPITQLAKADAALSIHVDTLLAAIPKYPTLSADPALPALFAELAQTNNRVTLGRQAFNDAVQTYNGAVQQMPTQVIAKLFGFKAATMLGAAANVSEQTPTAA